MLQIEIDDSAARAEVHLDKSVFIVEPKMAALLRKMENSDDQSTFRPLHLRAERRFLEAFHYSSVPDKTLDRPSAVCSAFVAAEMLKRAVSFST